MPPVAARPASNLASTAFARANTKTGILSPSEFAEIERGEAWLLGVHIPEYSQGTWTNHSARRKRKLLMHRREIDSLTGKIREGNQTLVPLSMYFNEGRVKVELALAKGKQDYDKRHDIARRTAERELVRELGRRVKGMRG